MPDRISAGSTGAQLRGDIQSGDTGDKRPGFDPALAPLETDSEAGGAGLDGRTADLDRAGRRSDVGRGPIPPSPAPCGRPSARNGAIFRARHGRPPSRRLPWSRLPS